MREAQGLRGWSGVALGLLAMSLVVVEPPAAEACGCLSPPVPIGDDDYAVNQQAEQIIFEVDAPWVTAHVMISYAGDPASFAWLVPVPEAPQLGLSPTSAFGLLDRETRPQVEVRLVDLCPVSPWQCRTHGVLQCDPLGGWPGFADAGFVDASGPGAAPVEVIATEIVGDYQTVTFAAAEAQAAVTWLRGNGFIVNPTTARYMEPYVEAGMVFVAAKLVPGADVSSIKPLRLRYRAPFPMIPLVLTAVAAEPHLTVTAQIYGGSFFKPLSHPLLTTVPVDRLAVDASGRDNYPMVRARAVDDAGGDAFLAEYRGAAPRLEFSPGSGCCGSGFDACGLGGNDRCECPRDDFDRLDCGGASDVVDGVALLDRLAAAYPRLTRLTTRISPEEMRFDPTFGPDVGAQASGRLRLATTQDSLAGCRDRVIDRERLAAIEGVQACATVYCGDGECTATASGGGCACDPGRVARQFVDLDGGRSVTCVPAVAPVDLGAGGLALPDACAGVDCGLGDCHPMNGVATCACDGGAAAVVTADGVPRCVPIDGLSRGPGAEDYSVGMNQVRVCAAPPPTCEGGWLELGTTPRPGVDCGDSAPRPEQLVVPPAPTCASDDDDRGLYGCGGCAGGGSGPLGAIAGGLLVAFALGARRRRG